MGEPAFYSTGSWVPCPGQEESFLEAWQQFAGWATSMPGAMGDAILVRDLRDTSRFVSFLSWESLEAIQAWKADIEFKPRMGLVQAHVNTFAPTETEVVARVHAGS